MNRFWTNLGQRMGDLERITYGTLSKTLLDLHSSIKRVWHSIISVKYTIHLFWSPALHCQIWHRQKSVSINSTETFSLTGHISSKSARMFFFRYCPFRDATAQWMRSWVIWFIQGHPKGAFLIEFLGTYRLFSLLYPRSGPIFDFRTFSPAQSLWQQTCNT